MNSLSRTVLIVVLPFLLFACGEKKEEALTTHVKGRITVADSVDASGNFSGIGITIIKKDSANADADTLFHETTAGDGTFSGTARFPEKRRYTMLFSRNSSRIGAANVILADGDTLTVSGVLPALDRTLKMDSREHQALNTFQRVDRQFRRVLAYARLGEIPADSLNVELEKWINIYWEVYEDHEGTMASRFAAAEALRLMEGWKGREMMQRLRSIQDDDDLAGLAARYGKEYLAETHGLDRSLSYLDTLLQITEEQDIRMYIQMERIKLLYDSARTEEARQRLEAFRGRYAQNMIAKRWADDISYDLNYLSPGDSIPDFEFRANGGTLSKDSLLGSPYILEITSLTNPLYQEQYDRTVVIHSIYKNFGLDVVTIPLDTSQVTVDSFFEERVRPWVVAPAKAFERDVLLKTFNITAIPTRFLVDREGRIVRKYVGREYKDVIQGIQSLMKEEEPAS